jgi:hypothetical protein
MINPVAAIGRHSSPPGEERNKPVVPLVSGCDPPPVAAFEEPLLLVEPAPD